MKNKAVWSLLITLCSLGVFISCDFEDVAITKSPQIKANQVEIKECKDSTFADYQSAQVKCSPLSESQFYFDPEEAKICQESLRVYRRLHGKTNCHTENQADEKMTIGYDKLLLLFQKVKKASDLFKADSEGGVCSKNLITIILSIQNGPYHLSPSEAQSLKNRSKKIKCFIPADKTFKIEMADQGKVDVTLENRLLLDEEAMLDYIDKIEIVDSKTP